MTLRDTDQDWSAIAEQHPYWAVLSDDGFRGQTLDPAAQVRFFESGERQVGQLFGFIKQHLQPEFTPARVLDFGCGVGRLLIPMARLAARAVGVDVAPRMIALCRENLAAAGLAHARVVQGDDALSAVKGSFDFVNSLIVLQHIPPARGIALIERLIGCIAIGGVGSIQVTYAKERRLLVHEAPHAHYFRRDGNTLHDLSPSATPPPPGTITMYDYDLNQVMLTIAQAAGHPILALPSSDDGHAGIHFVFTRAR